jgi:hypothetical protein
MAEAVMDVGEGVLAARTVTNMLFTAARHGHFLKLVLVGLSRH